MEIHPEVLMINQEDYASFKECLDSAASTHGQFTMMLVDDDVFVRPFLFGSEEIKILGEQTVLAYSSRLYPGITRCYTRNCDSPPPNLSDALCWKWSECSDSSDWGWPGSVDGNIYKTSVLQEMISSGSYTAPNSLEWAMMKWISSKACLSSIMFCGKNPSVINIPSNVVQTDHPSQSRSSGFSHDVLNMMFIGGRRISMSNITGVSANSPHVEISPIFESQQQAVQIPMVVSIAAPSVETFEKPSSDVHLFDNSFVISLKTRPEKLSGFLTRASRHGIDAVRHFEAIVPPAGVSGLSSGLSRRPGALGCYLSHQAIISMSKSMGFDIVAVFEDDADFCVDFKKKAQALFDKLPSNWDILFLGSIEVFGQAFVSDGLATGTLSYGTHCYIVNGRSFQKIIDAMSTYSTSIDDLLTSRSTGLNCYYALPSLSRQINGVSDIDGGYKVYTNAMPKVAFDPIKPPVNAGLPVVHIFGAKNIELKTSDAISRFESRLDCRCHMDDSNLGEILARTTPSAIISFGPYHEFTNLCEAPFWVRSLWLGLKDTSDLQKVGNDAFLCYIEQVVSRRKADTPFVSVFTCAFNSGKMIERPYLSLKNQTYREWEWVIYDDSDDKATSRLIDDMAAKDYHIRVVRGRCRTGNVGYNKLMACRSSLGEILVELDHDDELTTNALSDIADAFVKHPDAGFVYTDFAECHEDFSPVFYGNDPDNAKPPNGGWAFGYGSYRKESYKGYMVYVGNSPNINPKTIRHIVASPNHARCWRTSTYFQIGGHNPMLHVVDDYELVLRTFLHTRMVRVPKLCYVQYRNNNGNTHKSRNGEIQRLTNLISVKFNEKIHNRFVELGIDDWVYEKGATPWIVSGNSRPDPKVEAHVTITAGEVK